jgi:arylsulfatase A-like enzyme
VIGLWLLACGAEPPARPGPASSVEPVAPDVILLVVDTLRADHLGVYGHERPTSPQLDAWAATGVIYDDAQAHSGWTLPSMASLLTGLLPHEHQAVRDPSQDGAQSSLLPEHLTLAEIYRSGGRRTGGFTNNTFLDPVFGLDQGFDHYDHQGAGPTVHRSAEDTVDAALA